jgi:N-formylglutamate amidohydrolase
VGGGPGGAWEIHRFGDRPSVVVHVPHAGLVVPDDVRAGIVLDDADLVREMARMTDRHTDQLALNACESAAVDAIVVVNRLSRLVVDPERLPDAQEPMAAIGMGAVYLATAHLGVLREPEPRRDAALREMYFEPYAAAVAAVVDEVLDATGGVTILDVHSYPSVALPYERERTRPRPGVCLGTDPTHTPADLVDAARAAFSGTGGGVELDVPFAGTYVPLSHFGTNTAVRSLMLEIRRDLYMDEETLGLHDGVDDVVARLSTLLEAV